MANAKTQTAKFCTRRMLSTQMTTQKLTLARPSRHPPNPITPGPGTCTGSSNQPINASAVRALMTARRVSMTSWAEEAVRRKETRGSAERSGGPAISALRA